MYRRKWLANDSVYGETLLIYHGRYIANYIRWLHRLGWKIIYLERTDIVNQAFSNIIAMRTRHFHTEFGDEEPREKHIISGGHIYSCYTKQSKMAREREKKILQGINYKQVYYEKDLMTSEKRDRSLPAIFEFLSIEPEKVDATLRKTYSHPYSQIVENYDSLMERLKKDGYTDLYELHVGYEANA